jgi:signal transduction histidine kinase
MDIRKLLRFCKSLAYVTGIRINAIYPDGRIVTARGRKEEDICRHILTSSKGKEICMASLEEMRKRLCSEPGECVELECLLGMRCVGFSFDESPEPGTMSFVLCSCYGEGERDLIARNLERDLGLDPESTKKAMEHAIPIPMPKLKEAANVLRAVMKELVMEWRTETWKEELRKSNEILKAKITQMELLFKITSLVQKDIELERRLYAILTCITAGHGLGFNRAFLFLSNKSGDKLIGEMAIGPSSVEEAYRIWSEVSSIYSTLDEMIEFGTISDSEINRRVKGVEIAIDREGGILSRAVIEGRPIIWRSTDEGISPILLGILGPTDECVVVPLIVRGRVIGVIVADNAFNKVPISQEAVDLLMAFCDHAAIAIDTARLYSEIKDALLKERAVYEVGLMASSTFDLDALLALLAESAARVISADGTIVRLLDPASKELKVAAIYGIGEEVVKHEEGISDIFIFERDAMRLEGEKPFPYSAIYIPLISKEDMVGIMSVYTSKGKEGKKGIGDEEIRVLRILANQAAVAIENAKLYRNLQEKIRELEEAGNYIREQARKMAEREKMSALGEMVAVVAHELRNPLVSIGGFARIMDRKAGPNDPIRPYVKIIIEEVSRLERIIANMLDYTNPSPPSLKPSDLNEIVKKAITVMSYKAHEKGIVLSYHVDPSIPVIPIDPDQIYQVIINLVENAINVLEPTGGAIEVRTYFRGEKAILEVEDTGPGIPEEMLPRIFEPFFTTRAHGTGLGLHVTRRIIKDHGGEIEIRSELGKGTVFSIQIPIPPIS